MKIQIQKQGFDLKTKIKDLYRKRVTRFGTSAKIDCSKKYLEKDAVVLIPKKTTKKKIFDIKTLYSKKVTRFGTGAKIDCPKEYIGKDVVVLIL